MSYIRGFHIDNAYCKDEKRCKFENKAEEEHIDEMQTWRGEGHERDEERQDDDNPWAGLQVPTEEEMRQDYLVIQNLTKRVKTEGHMELQQETHAERMDQTPGGGGTELTGQAERWPRWKDKKGNDADAIRYTIAERQAADERVEESTDAARAAEAIDGVREVGAGGNVATAGDERYDEDKEAAEWTKESTEHIEEEEAAEAANKNEKPRARRQTTNDI